MFEVFRIVFTFLTLLIAGALVTPPAVYYFYKYLDYWWGDYHAATKSAAVANNAQGPCSMPSRD